MTQHSESTQRASVHSPTEQESGKRFFTFERVVIGSVSIFVALYIILFLVGLIAAIIWGESAATFFAYFRDLIITTLSLTSMMIIIGVGILIIQIARLVNLIRSEIKSVSEDTQAVVKNVRTTTEFVQKHAVQPVIQTNAFVAGLLAFLREIIRITRMLQSTPQPESETQDSPEG